MVVEVVVENINKRTVIVANEDNDYLSCNGKESLFSGELFIERLIPIVVNWNDVMINNSVLDGVRYSIKIKNNGKERTIIGKNIYPINYREFSGLIAEVENYEINS